MDTIFPFGFPGPTAFYLVVYVATLVSHVIFMNYVLAGSAYLAFAACFPGGGDGRPIRLQRPVALILSDWMPFAISGAITAGVAPLLFVQILYQQNFYTANLLLFHRWMAVLPALIVGFYFAYLFKSNQIRRWGPAGRAAIGLVMLLCFAFTGYSWTENHALSGDSAAWPQLYASGAMLYANVTLLPRYAMWVIGAGATMAMLLGWQMWYLSRRNMPAAAAQPGNEAEPPGPLTPGLSGIDLHPQARPLAMLAIVSLLLAGGAGVSYLAMLPDQVRQVVLGSLGGWYFYAAVAGVAVQCLAWLQLARVRRLNAKWLSAVTAGCVITIAGMAVVREVVRLASIDVPRFFAEHAESAQKAGFWVFVAFVVINGSFIAYVFYVVRTGRVESIR